MDMDASNRDFEFIDHTADYGIAVRGTDFQQLLKAAAEGLMELMADVEKITPVETVQLQVHGESREQLLVRALSEIALLPEQGQLPTDVQITVTDEDYRAHLTIHVAELAEHLNSFHTTIKAVTYHNLEIESQPDGSLTTEIIFDV